MYFILEGAFLPPKGPSKESEMTGTESRIKRKFAESVQTLHAGMRLEYHTQVT